MQSPRRHAGARLGGRLARLGIIRRLRHHSDRAARHSRAGANPGGSTMSHLFCGAWPLTVALAISTLSRRMVQRPTAAPLVACRRPPQLLPPAQLLAAPRAIRLSTVAPAADPHGDPAAPAVIPPIRSHPNSTAHTAGQRRGKQAYRACGKAPTGAPQPGARDQTGIGARALAFIRPQA